MDTTHNTIICPVFDECIKSRTNGKNWASLTMQLTNKTQTLNGIRLHGVVRRVAEKWDLRQEHQYDWSESGQNQIPLGHSKVITHKPLYASKQMGGHPICRTEI